MRIMRKLIEELFKAFHVVIELYSMFSRNTGLALTFLSRFVLERSIPAFSFELGKTINSLNTWKHQGILTYLEINFSVDIFSNNRVSNVAKINPASI